MQKENKDYLIMLSVKEIRLEAKKLSIPLYSRKNKEELIELILKDRVNVLIRFNNNEEQIALGEKTILQEAKVEEERKTFENAKAVEEKISLEEAKAQEGKKNHKNAKAVEEKIALEEAKVEEERNTFENANALEENITLEEAKAEEERKTFENANALEENITLEEAKTQEDQNINSDVNSKLKRLLSESFPNKKVSVTDNKDGSQTILIH